MHSGFQGLRGVELCMMNARTHYIRHLSSLARKSQGTTLLMAGCCQAAVDDDVNVPGVVADEDRPALKKGIVRVIQAECVHRGESQEAGAWIRDTSSHLSPLLLMFSFCCQFGGCRHYKRLASSGCNFAVGRAGRLGILPRTCCIKVL